MRFRTERSDVSLIPNCENKKWLKMRRTLVFMQSRLILCEFSIRVFLFLDAVLLRILFIWQWNFMMTVDRRFVNNWQMLVDAWELSFSTDLSVCAVSPAAGGRAIEIDSIDWGRWHNTSGRVSLLHDSINSFYSLGWSNWNCRNIDFVCFVDELLADSILKLKRAIRFREALLIIDSIAAKNPIGNPSQLP